MYTAERFRENPIIHPDLNPSIGTNINGPSLIRVPEWIENPLGSYYLYFASHNGRYIRLAYSNDLHGPWKIHVPGTLRLEQTCCSHHIASPDVHIDRDKKQIIMYFHGCVKDDQRSFAALSRDGLNFKALAGDCGSYYLRRFIHNGWFYGITKSILNEEGCILFRSRDGLTGFEQGKKILPRMRHAAVLKKNDFLHIFYSRGEDCPERILMSEIKLKDGWNSWEPGPSMDILAPETDYEGGNLKLEPSEFGATSKPARQLRDPAIFQENKKIYLIYSCAGESSLAIADLCSIS
jgi:hypothetical protein